ncbi:hypothetical protein QUF58_10145 [Anaerolineales bacterium HSG24]|nr:hypothetical protein [Anaerolineales bacterium HSG24]
MKSMKTMKETRLYSDFLVLYLVFKVSLAQTKIMAEWQLIEISV